MSTHPAPRTLISRHGAARRRTAGIARGLAAAALGAGITLLLPRGTDTRTPQAPLALPDGVRASVSSSAALAPWALGILGAATGAAAVRAPRRPLPALAVAAVTCALRRVDVTVGRSGVRIRSGLPGLAGAIPLTVIRSARAATVTTGEYGGLGLRWSLRRGPGLILRPGPALALETARGPLVLTVDDPHTLAALINRPVDAGSAA